MVKYNPIFKEQSYYNIFKCDDNLLNRLDATDDQSCMATSRDKYYTEMYETLIEYNERNDAPLSNEKI